MSHPGLVFLMTLLLELTPGDRVLEIGTGSGYQASVLATMGMEVYTIEIQEKLYKLTAPKLEKYYPGKINHRLGDGFVGWPEIEGHFDAIIVTAGIEKLPESYGQQVKVGGHIVIPIDNDFDRKGAHILVRYTKTEKEL